VSRSEIRGRTGRTVLLSAACLVVASIAGAQERRPSEAELFGGKPAEPPKAAAPGSAAPAPTAPDAAAAPSGSPGAEQKAPGDAAAAQTPAQNGVNPAAAAEASTPGPAKSTPADGRDEAILGGHESQMFTEEAAPSDPLRIGGQLYLRMLTSALSGQKFEDYSFAAPALLDVYLDVRPNDRVRGFVLGRMFYDPTLPSSPNEGTGTALGATGTNGNSTLAALYVQQTRDPKVFLDQIWLRFDIAHSVFVTAGKQHVRWGTGRFWSPTDFLHLRFRNPLEVFDARTGTTMVKLHVPIESKAWNFYAYGITENTDATQTISRIAGAARAEFVVETAEFGVGALVRRDQDPRIAADFSVGIGDFDLYGEMALKNASEIDRVYYDSAARIPDPPTTPQAVVDELYPVYRNENYRPQVVGGLNYSRKYNDNDTFTVGAEYFYNGLGYSNTDAYPGLVLPHSTDLAQPAPFFYLGRHYGALYVTFPAPFSLDLHTFTLSTLGNISDQSFITRFDYALVLLTHLRFEAFTSARYGNPYGEFRFGVKPISLGSMTFSRAPAIFDVGLALRLSI
jgi:hypothetical protein